MQTRRKDLEQMLGDYLLALSDADAQAALESLPVRIRSLEAVGKVFGGFAKLDHLVAERGLAVLLARVAEQHPTEAIRLSVAGRWVWGRSGSSRSAVRPIVGLPRLLGRSGATRQPVACEVVLHRGRWVAWIGDMERPGTEWGAVEVGDAATAPEAGVLCDTGLRSSFYGAWELVGKPLSEPAAE